MDKIAYTTEDILKDFSQFKDSVEFNELKNRNIDCIVPIVRGGLFASHLLSYALGVRNILPVDISFYEKESKSDINRVVTTNMNQIFLQNIGKYKSILVVDDIVDSGDTIYELENMLRNSNIGNIAIFVLVNNKTSPVNINYHLKENSDNWIVFDWDKFEC